MRGTTMDYKPVDEELLISLVRQFRELYDLAHDKYHDEHRRARIWKKIATRMNELPHVCKDHWKRIRDNYRKAIKLRQTKPIGKQRNKPIRYGKDLEFLIPFLSCSEKTTTAPVGSDDDRSFPDSIPESASESSILSNSNKTSQTRRMEITTPQIVDFMPSYLENNYQQAAMQRFSNDETNTVVDFFTNLGHTAKTFPPDVLLRVKSAVFKVINDAESEILLGSQMSTCSNCETLQHQEEDCKTFYIPGSPTYKSS